MTKMEEMSVMTATSWIRTSAVHGLLSLLFIYFKFNLFLSLGDNDLGAQNMFFGATARLSSLATLNPRGSGLV